MTGDTQNTHPHVRHSSLHERLNSSKFLIIAEVYPPGGADASEMIERFAPLHNRIDAVNVADCPMAIPLMSGFAASALFERVGISAIFNMTCRDRNIIALQSDMLGAAALGIEAIFCVSGDPPSKGDHPDARAVYELDALRLITLARQLRDEGIFESGRPLVSQPSYLIGGAGSLFLEPLQEQAERTAGKIAAGADFIQTPPMFDIARLREFTAHLQQLGALEQARLIAGVSVVTSIEQALWLQAEMPGSRIPDRLIEQLAGTPRAQQRAAGLSYAAEMIGHIREIAGISGVLLYAPEEDEVATIGELLDMTGLA